jgi:membrane-associated phospholipid phosphatase
MPCTERRRAGTFGIMWTLIRQNALFFGPYLLVLLIVGGWQAVYTQTELMQWVNARYSPAADVFFTYVTYLGDGAFFAVVFVSLLFRSFRWTVKCLVSFLLTTLAAQGLKHLFFPDSLRPRAFYESSGLQFHTVDGVVLHSFNSFPSGHSTSAFALFCLLALMVRDKRWGVVFLVLACLAAYSRVYLFQHFVEDVYVGSLLGVGLTLLSFSALQGYWQRKPKPWLDRRIRLRRRNQ